MRKKILLTGGLGYIGSHTCVELLQHGFDVAIIDNLSNSKIEVLDRIFGITGIKPEFSKLDLLDSEMLNNYFLENRNIEGVIHFAAYKAVGESWEDPLKYYKNNVNGLVNLLVAMQLINCNNLVFSSSCTVYGQPDEMPVSEDSPIKKAMSPYANTKKMCEEIISDKSLSSKLNAISLRYFNPIGAHPSVLIGELPLGVPNNLVPFLTQTSVGKRKCLNVYGDDYDTPDGTGIRDYIHVVDLASAHLMAIERLLYSEESKAYEVFNLGTGRGYSVMDIIKTFEKISDKKLNYQIVPRRSGDIEQIWANPEKANSILGWSAKRNIEEMLESAWLWELRLTYLEFENA